MKLNVLFDNKIPVKVCPELRHLSPNEIQNLVWDYFDQSLAIRDVIMEYNLPVGVKHVHEILPPQVLEQKCPVCGHPMVRELPTKTQMKNIKSKDEDHGYVYVEKYAYCPNCGHTEAPDCECYLCVERRNKEKAEKDKIVSKNKKIVEDYNERAIKSPRNINDLNYKERLYLISLIRFASTSDMNQIGPLEKFDGLHNCLAVGDMEQNIVNYLFNNNLIKISLDSPDDAFYCEKEVFDYRFAIFDFNIEYEGDKNDLIDKLSDFEIDFSNEDILDELESLWKETALEHCLRFYKREVAYHYKQEEIIIRDKVKVSIKDLLKTHSVNQIYDIIFKSIKLKTINLGKKEIKYEKFENEVVNLIWNYSFDNHTEYSTKVKELSPIPIFTQILFAKLKIYSKGYQIPPNKKIIKECNS